MLLSCFDGFILLFLVHTRIVNCVNLNLNGFVVAALVEGITINLEANGSFVEVLDVVVGNAVHSVHLLVVEVVVCGVAMTLFGRVGVVRVVLHSVRAEKVRT